MEIFKIVEETAFFPEISKRVLNQSKCGDIKKKLNLIMIERAQLGPSSGLEYIRNLKMKMTDFDFKLINSIKVEVKQIEIFREGSEIWDGFEYETIEEPLKSSLVAVNLNVDLDFLERYEDELV